MKTNYIFAALAVVALASCSKSATIEQSPMLDKSPISFQSYNAGTTRASQVGTSDVQSNGFNVSAYFNAPDQAPTGTTSGWFFKNNNVAYSTDRYSTAYFWPGSGTMDFYAVYPKTVSISDTKTIANYSSDGKVDLLVANELAENCATHSSSQSLVAVAFNHALTYVSFSAKGSDAGYDYIISKITVTAKDNATYTFSTTDAQIGTWDVPTEDKSYKYFDGTTTPVTVNNTALTPITGDEQIYIPQVAGAKVKIEYQIKHTDTKVLVKDYTGDNGKTFTTTAAWTSKSQVRYNLTLPMGANPIEFTATVNAWDTETAIAVGDGQNGSLSWNN